MGPLWRMRRPGQGEDVVGADPCSEPREGRVGHVAAGGRVAADQPGRDAIGGRIGKVGQPAVPVAVVEQDRAGSVDIDLGQRLRLGEDVLGGPVRVLCGEPVAVGLEVGCGSSDGSLAISEMSA